MHFNVTLAQFVADGKHTPCVCVCVWGGLFAEKEKEKLSAVMYF